MSTFDLVEAVEGAEDATAADLDRDVGGVLDVLLDRQARDLGDEIDGPFRSEVREDLRERFADGWTVEEVLDARQDHLHEAVDRYGRTLSTTLAVRVVDTETCRVTGVYPHESEVGAGPR